MDYTAAQLQDKPITVKCTGLKPIYMATITDASGEMITNVTRVEIDLDIAQGGCVPTAKVTLLEPEDSKHKRQEKVATTDNVQLEIDAIAEAHHE